MPDKSSHATRFALTALFLVLLTIPITGQKFLPPQTIPPNFTADAKFAAQIRAQLVPHTEPAARHYPIAQQVIGTLLQHLPADTPRFSWNLRVAPGIGNIFSSPDGTIFIDENLAQLMGSHAGLWAAALSHEIAHVIHRDWARRYLFQKSLQEGGASQLALGEATAFSGSWLDARSSSALLAAFNQEMEFEADAQSLQLMARAGFHPDFVPALHHLLQAQLDQLQAKSSDTSHPRWDERDERQQKLYAAAGREYDRLWPARYASPGGNPPIVVYAGSTSTKRNLTGDLELLIPLHCQNLSGAVEVVLRYIPDSGEFRQITGCTSDRTLITFTLSPTRLPRKHPQVESEISVLDDSGALLTRALAPVH
jgi:Zn-dependent protease with chaperone function